MAYNPYFVERIRAAFIQRNVIPEERNMMGGRIFMVDSKMCVGTDQDKTTGEDRLMVRIGKEAYEKATQLEGTRDMDFTGTVMKNYIYIYPEGTDTEEYLAMWIQKALDHNPFAKRSPSKRKKKK